MRTNELMVKMGVNKPSHVGPDGENERWLAGMAQSAMVPDKVLQKVRVGDPDVSVSIPQIQEYETHKPVLIDDIISTARTRIDTTRHLKNLRMKRPICIGVHAVFAENAYQYLIDSGVKRIATCNSILHISNEIDLPNTLAASIIECETANRKTG